MLCPHMHTGVYPGVLLHGPQLQHAAMLHWKMTAAKAVGGPCCGSCKLTYSPAMGPCPGLVAGVV